MARRFIIWQSSDNKFLPPELKKKKKEKHQGDQRKFQQFCSLVGVSNGSLSKFEYSKCSFRIQIDALFPPSARFLSNFSKHRDKCHELQGRHMLERSLKMIVCHSLVVAAWLRFFVRFQICPFFSFVLLFDDIAVSRYAWARPRRAETKVSPMGGTHSVIVPL